jgi:protein-tyrosine phosphatase
MCGNKPAMKKVVFVCLGNICRSAMAEGILRAKVENSGLKGVTIDSAGTSNWHIGNAPDRRAITTTAAKGIDISYLRARQITPADFEKFDLIIAMDRDNDEDMKAVSAPEHHQKIRLCLDFSSLLRGGDVPDPYYGGDDGFKQVWTLLDDACDGILREMTSTSA